MKQPRNFPDDLGVGPEEPAGCVLPTVIAILLVVTLVALVTGYYKTFVVAGVALLLAVL